MKIINNEERCREQNQDKSTKQLLVCQVYDLISLNKVFI